MILRYYRATICTFCAVAVLAAGPTLAAESMLRAVPSSFSFGHIPEGVKVYGTYWLANDGGDAIHIKEVKPQCGCTAAPLVQDVVSPADSIALEFTFNSSKMHGLVHKRINIYYDDTMLSPTSVYFTANVDDTTGSIVAQPSRAIFEDFDKIKEDIILTNPTGDQYTVTVETLPPSYVKYSIDHETIAPGDQAVLTLQLSDSVPLGLYQSSMTLSLHGRVSHAITIPIGGTGYVR